jgi:HSP20 family protein
MNEFVQSIGNTVMKQIGRVASRFQEERALASDLLESEDEYLVVFDVPGVTTSDVAVRYESGAIRVRVDRFRDHYEGYTMRFPGRGLSLDGRRRLPQDADVDASAARARLDGDGTLSVFLPKRESGFDTGDEDTPFTEKDETWAEPPAENADAAESESSPDEPDLQNDERT